MSLFKYLFLSPDNMGGGFVKEITSSSLSIIQGTSPYQGNIYVGVALPTETRNSNQ